MSRGAPVVCQRDSDDKARERRRRATQRRDDAPLSDPRRRQRATRGDTIQVLSADKKQTEPGKKKACARTQDQQSNTMCEDIRKSRGGDCVNRQKWQIDPMP